MREFTFGIAYDSGSDPVMDVFIDHPDLVARSIDGCVTDDRFWRVERISGPAAALDRVEKLRFDDTVCGESITEADCEARRHHHVLERTNGDLTLYTYLDDIDGCESVHTLAGGHLPPGSIFETHRHADCHEWRVLARSDESAGRLYDSLRSNARSPLSIHVGHLGDANGWQWETLASVSLPSTQRETMRAAIERGYYEVPRQVTLDELADELDVPRSTLSYRLRQAEAKLARGYIEGRDSPHRDGYADRRSWMAD